MVPACVHVWSGIATGDVGKRPYDLAPAILANGGKHENNRITCEAQHDTDIDNTHRYRLSVRNARSMHKYIHVSKIVDAAEILVD